MNKLNYILGIGTITICYDCILLSYNFKCTTEAIQIQTKQLQYNTLYLSNNNEIQCEKLYGNYKNHETRIKELNKNIKWAEKYSPIHRLIKCIE